MFRPTFNTTNTSHTPYNCSSVVSVPSPSFTRLGFWYVGLLVLLYICFALMTIRLLNRVICSILSTFINTSFSKKHILFTTSLPKSPSKLLYVLSCSACCCHCSQHIGDILLSLSSFTYVYFSCYHSLHWTHTAPQLANDIFLQGLLLRFSHDWFWLSLCSQVTVLVILTSAHWTGSVSHSTDWASTSYWRRHSS